MDELSRQAAAIKARIASLRSRLSLGIESIEVPQTQREYYPTQRPTKEIPLPQQRPEQRIEPDKPKAVEMDTLMGTTPPEQIIEPAVAPAPPKFETDWDAIAKNKAKNDAKSAELNAMKAKLIGKK